MAEKESGGIGGWIKAAFSALFGLLSGAALMYLSPLVDRVVKPSKPLANFAVEVQGSQATFQNRSTGARDGWWDFGDGSPLEPFSPDQPSLVHTYPRPGSYSAKLSVQNLLGDENDRTVTVQIDGAAPGPAAITAFQVSPMGSDLSAPATFRVVGKVANADLCVWSDNSGQPMQVQSRPPAEQERLITFQQPGTYTIRLAAIQGTQVVERTQTVKVEAPRPGVAAVVLKVSRQTAPVESKQERLNIPVPMPADAPGNTYTFSVPRTMPAGWHITAAKLTDWCLRSPAVKDARLVVSPDGTKFMLTGQMVKQGGGFLKRPTAPASWLAGVELTLQRAGPPTAQPPQSVAAILNRSGPTLLAIPPAQSGQVVRQTISLDISDGCRPTPQTLAVPGNGTVLLQNQPWQLTATQQGNQVRIDVRALRPSLSLSGN